MNSFDEKMKYMADHEASIAPKGTGERIDRVLSGLHKENTHKRKRTPLRGGKLIAAAVAVCLLIGGTVYAAANWQSFDWTGNTSTNTRETPEGTGAATENAAPVELGGEIVDDTEYFDLDKIANEVADNEVFRVVLADGSGMQSADNDMIVSDYSSLERILVESNTILKLPAETPTAYEFQTARISFYLPPDFVHAITNPIETKSLDNDATLEIFKLPDEYSRYIRSVIIEYTNPNGDVLVYDVSLANGIRRFGGSATAQAETLTKYGYTNVLYLDDFSEEFVYGSRLYAKQNIENIQYVELVWADFDASSYPPESYDSIVYSIESTALDRDTLLSILK